MTLSFELSDSDVERIAQAVAAILEAQRGASSKGWMTVAEASSYTSLTEQAIRSAVKARRLKSSKGSSGRLVFEVAELDRFMGGD